MFENLRKRFEKNQNKIAVKKLNGMDASKDKEEQWQLLEEVFETLPTGQLQKDYERDTKEFNLAIPNLSEDPEKAIEQIVGYIDSLIMQCKNLYKKSDYKHMLSTMNAMSFAGTTL